MSPKILIIDDEVLIAEDIKDMLNALKYKNIFLSHTKEDAINKINTWKPDVVLLDIRMEQEKDGIEIGTFLLRHHLMPFIYITAHSDISMIQDIVKTKPFAYLTKPINKNQLLTNISLALAYSQQKKITVKDGYNYLVIQHEDILYIQAESVYLTVVTKQKRHILRKSLKAISEELNDAAFIRTHKSFIVNSKHITNYTSTEVNLLNTYNIPISRTYYDFFKREITK
ncbi:MAG: response regulator transcription factor [Bacteroidetes bacterium]|nr:response regulator transcription factor [Bacteroidota bacterium]